MCEDASIPFPFFIVRHDGDRKTLSHVTQDFKTGMLLSKQSYYGTTEESWVENGWSSTDGRGSACTPSQLPMGAETENRHRPAIAVIGRVANKLIVERQLGEFTYCHAVVGLQDGLNAGVDKLPVPHEDTKTTSGKELLCVP